MICKTATQQLLALNQGETSSIALVEEAVARIEAIDGAINAVVVRDFERARETARIADTRRKTGAVTPLLGLPVTVKEGFDVAGLPTSWGLPAALTATADSALVGRLKSAGAIVLGKTNVATMLADWQTANSRFGVTNNPWDTKRTPGGSSGGGAAAVAADLTPLDFGSDLAGSLRIPAAFCGVFAHRPSHGLVEMRGFAPPMEPRTAIAQSIDQSTAGPIARSAADLMLALDIVAGLGEPEATAFRPDLPRPRHAVLRDFRVLVIDDHPLTKTSNDIRSALSLLAAKLEREGCRVGRDAGEIPDMVDTARTFRALLMSFMGSTMPDNQYEAAASSLRDNRSNARSSERLEAENITISHRDWVRLDRHRLELSAGWRNVFRSWDVVVCPVAPTTAFRHDSRPFEERSLSIDGTRMPYDQIPIWTTLPTPCGLPVTTMPIGRDSDGLPIGVQIIGPRLEDRTPLAFSGLMEKAFGGFLAPPSPQVD
jgi:amidase